MLTDPIADACEYQTPAGLLVRRTVEEVDAAEAIEQLIDELDAYPGVLLASNFEFPGRYTRWSQGFARPPLRLSGRGRTLRIEALTERGEVPLAAIADLLATVDAVDAIDRQPRSLGCEIRPPAGRFAEEERSKQHSVFSALRAITEGFRGPADRYLGLYGAFGYDLVFQFENIVQQVARDPRQRDLVLYLPDQLVVVDHARELGYRCRYEFSYQGRDTAGLSAELAPEPYQPTATVDRDRDHAPGEFAAVVAKAKESFRRGDLFEVVPSQTFFTPGIRPPSTLFRRLRAANPAPFGALLNLGDQEYLVSASPEMYVRVEGRRVESCPISGTIRRGEDVFGDAQMIRELLNSSKDEAELTMCTDVDRNDKSRICEPGSVKVIGRRQIEVYSKVIHTVDHIEGQLRDGYDAIDAFLTHMWAVTVTGAPKLWAMRFIEQHERTPRGWYGGAMGLLGFDGNLNTGLTLRTVTIRDGVAQIRAGGTLLIDSDPAEEERESELKAAAFLEALQGPDSAPVPQAARLAPTEHQPRVLLLDCEDSFVHTLANYVRQAGAEVRTIRAPLEPGELEHQIESYRPGLLLLSPGPGRPDDFGVGKAIEAAISADIPVFGVCLGLQAIVEHLGGTLGLLDYPMHGKPSTIRVTGGRLLAGLPETFEAGRYHSIHALPDQLPGALSVTALSDDGVVMAIEHTSLPIAAVQFHPESIMSARGDVGLQLVHRVISELARP
ncbi:MAG TPA: anthranilate synthase component I [Natronosporangium sp.]